MQKFTEMKVTTRWDRVTLKWLVGDHHERHFPYRFLGHPRMLLTEFNEVVQWCESRAKRRKLWHHEMPKIMFREELDAFEFKMRWC